MPEDHRHLRQLRKLLGASGRPRATSRGWRESELLELPRLYRHACSLVARLEASGENPRLASEARLLVTRAHAILYRDREVQRDNLIVRLHRLFLHESPRTIRREWRLLTMTLALVYGLALLSWVAVARDLDLAPSLLDAGMVAAEIEQLEAMDVGESFRGNFTFGWGESPTTAGMIMLHNMGVGILFFASALVPPLYAYVLGTNGLMLGTYTGVAGHWGEAGSISSILWCHGVIEIQALILAGTAGLCLVRAWVRPGSWTRRYAMQLESKRALVLLAPVFPLLFIAGLIEGFVSPHAPLNVRLTVAVTTGALLVSWVLLGGQMESGRRS
jgi:uncharacterized membrane protein SpoIIM required for sporulation